MRITAWWHPARGIELRVLHWELKTRPPHVVVRRPDGSGERVALALTDAAGVEQVTKTKVRFTAESLIELAAILERVSSGDLG